MLYQSLSSSPVTRDFVADNPLPIRMAPCANPVRIGNSFMLVGGYNDQDGNYDTIWTYDILNEDWILNEVSLANPIRRHVAMMVDATLFKPCE